MTVMGLPPEDQREFYEPPKPRRYTSLIIAFILGLIMSAFAVELWQSINRSY